MDFILEPLVEHLQTFQVSDYADVPLWGGIPLEWWSFALIFVYLTALAVIEEPKGCLPTLLVFSGGDGY